MATSQIRIEKKRFIKWRLTFMKKMDDIPSFMDHALASGLFTPEHINKINSLRNVDDQKREILYFVQKKLRRKSEQFLKALIKSGNEILTRKLISPETDISDLEKRLNVEKGSLEFQDTNKYPIDIETFLRLMATSQIRIEEERFRKWTDTFLNKMDDVPSFMDHAVASGLFTPRHIEVINSLQDYFGLRQKRFILSRVLWELRNKSEQFLKALIKSGNEILIRELLPPETDISDLEKRFNLEIGSLEFKNRYPIDIRIFWRLRVEFIRNMSFMRVFIYYSIECKLLTQRHKNEILSFENSDDQTRKMIDIMEKKLPEKSDIFLYCLTKSNNFDLVKMLINQNPDFSHLKFPMEKRYVLRIQEADFRDIYQLYLENLCSSNSSISTFFGNSEFNLDEIYDFISAFIQFKTLEDSKLFIFICLIPNLSTLCSQVGGKDLNIKTQEEEGLFYGKPCKSLLRCSFKGNNGETIEIRAVFWTDSDWSNRGRFDVYLFGWRDNRITGAHFIYL